MNTIRIKDEVHGSTLIFFRNCQRAQNGRVFAGEKGERKGNLRISPEADGGNLICPHFSQNKLMNWGEYGKEGGAN